MTYNVADLAELIQYHLVVCAPHDAAADANLAQLVGEIEGMTARGKYAAAAWGFCDNCGCTVYEEVFAEDGSNFTRDGGFYCSDCIPNDLEIGRK